MNFFNKLSLEKMLKKFNKLNSTDGLAYFEDDDIKEAFRNLTRNSKDLDEHVYSVFKMQLIKSIKETKDLYVMPGSKQEKDCVRIIQLFAYELVQFEDINVLIRFLSLFSFSKTLPSRIAHLMTHCIHNDNDLNKVHRYLTEDQFVSLIENIQEGNRQAAIWQRVVEEHRLSKSLGR